MFEALIFPIDYSYLAIAKAEFVLRSSLACSLELAVKGVGKQTRGWFFL